MIPNEKITVNITPETNKSIQNLFNVGMAYRNDKHRQDVDIIWPTNTNVITVSCLLKLKSFIGLKGTVTIDFNESVLDALDNLLSIGKSCERCGLKDKKLTTLVNRDGKHISINVIDLLNLENLLTSVNSDIDTMTE